LVRNVTVWEALTWASNAPEDLDQLKVIGCPFLADQDGGLHSALVETVGDERLKQRLRLRHVLRIYIDMRNDDDFPKPVVKPVGMGGCAH
jgi:hypothetical protein